MISLSSQSCSSLGITSNRAGHCSKYNKWYIYLRNLAFFLMIPMKTDTLLHILQDICASPDFFMWFLLSILRPGISTWERCRVGKPTFGPSCCWRLGCIRLAEKRRSHGLSGLQDRKFPRKVGVKTHFFLKSFLEGTDSYWFYYILFGPCKILQVSLLAWLNLLSRQVDFPALTQVFAEQNQCTDRCHSVNQQ
jgi:hypothetical protein